MSSPWLEDEIIDELCFPLTQNAAKVRFLRSEFGVVVTRRKNGRPVVLREAWEARQRGIELAAPATKEVAPTKNRPNGAAVLLQFRQRGA